MKSRIALTALSLAACFNLAGCGRPSQPQSSAIAQPSLKVEEIARYSLPNGGEVIESRQVSDPSRVVISVDGYHASGIATVAFSSAGKSELNASYSNENGDVVEFTPASNGNMLCIYLDGYESGALTCAPKTAAPGA